nr:MAG TPA: hypothetical protein [Caudoviricetes sp.]
MDFSVKRKKIEKLVLDTYTKMDPSGRNVKKWKEIFASMSDKEFDAFCKELKSDSEWMTLDVVEYENPPTLENFEAAAKVIGIPLFERVAMPHTTMDKSKIVWSKHPVLVGYCNVKRPQQAIIKKNGASSSIEKRSSTTGQVVGEDKNGRETDLENSMMVAMGADAILKEMNGFRADDLHAKAQAYSLAGSDGFVRLSDLDDDVKNKTTLNTADVYFIGMGLKSDLVTPGNMLRVTIDKEA